MIMTRWKVIGAVSVTISYYSEHSAFATILIPASKCNKKDNSQLQKRSQCYCMTGKIGTSLDAFCSRQILFSLVTTLPPRPPPLSSSLHTHTHIHARPTHPPSFTHPCFSSAWRYGFLNILCAGEACIERWPDNQSCIVKHGSEL